MATKIKQPKIQNSMSKKDARQTLTAADYLALPFLRKKCTDVNNPEYGMWQEDRLVRHITERLQLADEERKVRIARCEEIDIQVSGVVNLDKEDKKRQKNNLQGKAPKPVKHNLALVYAQLDDTCTYLLSLFAPETNIFMATSNAQKQNVADGLTEEIGRQGQKLQYYRQLSKMCINALKYNFGGMSCSWEKQEGVVFQPDDNVAKTIKKANGILWQGNVLKSIDAYNFLFDTAVHPCDLATRGEYYAEVEAATPFSIQRDADQKILFGVNRFINTIAPIYAADSGTFFYQPPMIRSGGVSTAQGPNWARTISGGASSAQASQLGIEKVWFTAWMRPKDFGLSESKQLELWRLCMCQGKYIAAAVHIEDSHGQLPCAIAAPIEDDLGNNQRTYAEQLLPLQIFASFLLNTHVDATRKAIYGITVYDQNLFPGMDLDTEDLIGARIPMRSSATGIDIDKAFRHYNESPDTAQNVDMVGKIIDLMQKILPSNSLQQVADLERATEYQAAATVQASSRRNLKIARLINDQCLSVIKFQMLYNIFAHITTIEYTDAQGKQTQITPQDLLEANIEFDVGTGLKGLDRLMQVSIFKDIMSYLFQVKDIAAQVDLLGLLSYVTQLAGFETDLSSFRINAPPTAVNPDGTPVATQPQPAAAAPVAAPPVV